MAYGKELILDLYGCDLTTFNRESIKKWLDRLCELIGMNQEDLHFWDYEGVPDEEIPYDQLHLIGTSGVKVLSKVKTLGAIQFITTSDIVIHTLDILRECYINIFTCRELDSVAVVNFTEDWFGANKYEYQTIIRGKWSKK